MNPIVLEPGTRAFYKHANLLLQEAGIPFLVGGSYALEAHTGISRHTKDFDIFLKKEDCQRALDLFRSAGYSSEITFTHWLGKVFCEDDFLDLIYSSGNGMCPVDDSWFAHAVPGEVFGVPAKFCPPEEMIWQKAFIMERERFDGADVAHLLRACGPDLKWPRLLARFGPHWRVLFVHVLLFGFIYPAERSRIRAALLRQLLARLRQEYADNESAEGLCQGPLLSRKQYLVDLQHWGYNDARLAPHGRMDEQQIEDWTAAIPPDPTVSPQ